MEWGHPVVEQPSSWSQNLDTKLDDRQLTARKRWNWTKQNGVKSSYLKSALKSKLNSLSQLGSNVNIKNIPYDDEKTHIAYDIGAWFIAFLIHKTNEETYRVEFFKNLNEMGFEKSFMNSFGSSSDKLLEEFHNKFLKLSTEDMLKIIP